MIGSHTRAGEFTGSPTTEQAGPASQNPPFLKILLDLHSIFAHQLL
jgi:hypothetical protein